MRPQQQRIAIAEACGWEFVKWGKGSLKIFHPASRLDQVLPIRLNGRTIDQAKTDYISALPDYLNDLDAMHEAEEVLTGYPSKEWDNYIMDLHAVTQSTPSGKLSEIACITHATAAQRAEAFLRTLGLWEE